MTGFGLFLISMLGIGHQMTIPHTQIISRSAWGARPPKMVEHFQGPAPFVIIHHSYIPSACSTTDSCKFAMRSMQDFHQLDRGWNDIGYSFGIGGDGMVYTGRGFNVVGAHAPKYNDRSVGICLIGDWRTELPPKQMLDAVKELIRFGIIKGYIAPDFKLLGHRQVRETECPGGRLFDEISTWPNFAPEYSLPTPPASVAPASAAATISTAGAITVPNIIELQTAAAAATATATATSTISTINPTVETDENEIE